MEESLRDNIRTKTEFIKGYSKDAKPIREEE
jgi:hypothetical protein